MATARREVVLEARGLVKDYRRARRSTASTSLVHAGERVALLGPNGAGKTTTLLMILGVDRARRGCGRRSAGVDSRTTAAGRPRTSGSRPGYLPLAERLRVREYLQLYGSSTASPIPRPAIDAGLERFRDRAPRRRDGHRAVVGPAHARRHRAGHAAPAAAARARRADGVARPRRRAAGARGLRELCDDDGTALLVTSHDMAEVERLCERVVFLSRRPHRRRRHARRGRRPATAAATSKACSSISPPSGPEPTGATQQTRPPGVTPIGARRCRRTTRGDASLAADARGRAPARVRARCAARTASSTSRCGRWSTCCCSARSRRSSNSGHATAGGQGRGLPPRRHRALARHVPVADRGEHGLPRGDVDPQPAQPDGHAAARGRVRRRRRAVRDGQARRSASA